MLRGLEGQKSFVKDLLQAHNLEIYDQPFCSNLSIPISRDPVVIWNMRIGDPATNQDFLFDAQSEYRLWLKAEHEIREYIAKKSDLTP